MNEAEVKIKSIKKTVDVLNCFVEKQPLGVTEISDKLGLYKSNVHSILSTLVAMEYLEQDRESGKYYLGIGVLRLAQAVGDHFNFHDIAGEYMQQLSDEVHEVVYLTVPMRGFVYYLDAAFPAKASLSLTMGGFRNTTNYLHTTSCGKAMLAFMPEDVREEYLSRPLPACTENTITDPVRLREQFARIRANGYATENMESELGTSCVGVPIISRSSGVMGALSISGPTSLFTTERMTQLAERLKLYARKIESFV